MAVTKLLEILTSTKDGKIDLGRFIFLKKMLSGYLTSRQDVTLFLSLFFPPEEIARAIATVKGRSYATLQDFKKRVSIKDAKIGDGIIYIQQGDNLIVGTYLFSDRILKDKLIVNLGKVYDRVQLYQISIATYMQLLSEYYIVEDMQGVINKLLEENVEEKISQIYHFIVEQAVYRKASDIHFMRTKQIGIVRARIVGTLETLCFLPLPIYDALVMNYIPTKAGKNPLTNIPRTEDARDTLKLKSGEEIDLRIALAPSSPFSPSVSYSCVIRILRRNASLMAGLESLGLTKREYGYLISAIKSTGGLILTSGPTSSGKTTTLYGILQNIDWGRKVITIEDPVEFSNPYLWTQHQVFRNTDPPLVFEEYQKIVLREDPDVILIGEIRDRETAKAMIEMANTGHLVLSTIHANNSVDLVKRLKELGVSVSDISQYGLIFMAQRLLRKSCPYCRYEDFITEEEAELLGYPNGVKVYRNAGCDRCNGTGALRERVLVLELLPVLREDVQEYLKQGLSYREIFRRLKEDDVYSMGEKAYNLMQKGVVSLNEIKDKLR